MADPCQFQEEIITSKNVWDEDGALYLQHLAKPIPWKPNLNLKMQHISNVDHKLSSIVNFDLSSHISSSGYCNQREIILDGALYFPDSILIKNFHQLKRGTIKGEIITPYLKRACAEAGFQCVCGNVSTVDNGRIRKHIYCCFHGTFQQEKRAANKDKRNKHSNKPQKDLREQCKFRFEVCEDIVSGKFFLQRNVTGIPFHNGHHKLDPKQVHVPAKCLDGFELQNIIDQLTLHVKPSQIKINRFLFLFLSLYI